jgi:hypothetical protein
MRKPCGSAPPLPRAPLRARRGAKWSRRTSGGRLPISASRCVIPICAARSCISRNVPNAPRSWPSAKLAAKHGSYRLTVNIACRCSGGGWPHRLSARGRARADAQGRGDGVGSEEIGSREPSRTHHRAREGLSFGWRKTKTLYFFGEAPEQRPWAIKREDRPAVFAGRSDGIFSGAGYTLCLHRRVSYPALLCHQAQPATESAKSVRKKRENFEGKEPDALQLAAKQCRFALPAR